MINEESDNWGDAIESVVRRVLYNEVSTFFPGKIVKVKDAKVNPNTKIVDVESSFLAVDPDTNEVRPRIINSVPLMMIARTNTFIIRPPLDEASLINANVGLVVSNNYLANWKKTGGTVLPTRGRKYHYADAVAIFGLYPDLTPWNTPPKENTAQMKTLDGTFMEIGNSTTDIPRVMADVMNILSTATDSLSAPLTLLPSALSGKTIIQLMAEFATLYNPDPTP